MYDANGRIPYSVTVSVSGVGDKNAEPPLFKTLKKEAKRQGITTKALAEQILNDWLAQQQGAR